MNFRLERTDSNDEAQQKKEHQLMTMKTHMRFKENRLNADGQRERESE